MRKLFHFCFFALLFVSCQLKSGEVFVTKEGAIGGYDPVAYFSANMPVKGTKELAAEWNGATWYFSSQSNLDAFKAEPLRYVPQYGGYCAYGTAEGHKAPTQPNAWTIVNGKLYLNYNLEVKRYWMEDQAKLIVKADSNWTSLKSAR